MDGWMDENRANFFFLEFGDKSFLFIKSWATKSNELEQKRVFAAAKGKIRLPLLLCVERIFF